MDAQASELPPEVERLRDLQSRYGALDGAPLLRAMTEEEFPGRLAVSSSFGIEAAALLALTAEVDPSTPVVFLDTGQLFPETLAYRDTLIDTLALSDVRSITPDIDDIATYDPKGNLNTEDADTCCYLRKVQPLEKALKGFDAWATGRKRFHGGERGSLQSIELSSGRIKINPLAGWGPERIAALYEERRLPRHPLEASGYKSVGCAPCTRLTKDGEDVRAGRWADMEKTECGIHNAPWFGQGI